MSVSDNNINNPQANTTATRNPTQNKPENIWLNLGLNILLPSILLMKGAKLLARAGYEAPPALILVIALMFPVVYGIYDFQKRRKYNFFSVLGFISILITGSVGLLHLDKDWIAVKEAAVPALFGLAVLATLKTRKPLVRLFLYNDQVIDVPKVEAELDRRGNRTAFDALLVVCTLLLAVSFLVSAILNFVLATILIKSPSGTEAFNEELGRMTFWSYPVIMVPSMIVLFYALLKLFKGIKALTGFEVEDILLNAPKAPKETE